MEITSDERNFQQKRETNGHFDKGHGASKTHFVVLRVPQILTCLLRYVPKSIHLGIDGPQIPFLVTFDPCNWSRAVRASQDTIPKFKTSFIQSIAPSLPRSAQALAVSITHLTDSTSLLLNALANRPRLQEPVQPICASTSCYLMLF